ncbi:unnamed protein product [Caenorhabditis angaria]|uniref:Decapping nuclease n=1 Tax=Caenorhabditis angaria TaxID=860376 RepID=A0A9P1IX80_9PELO|nr:unnamed protein product [Caenorhabditis angaria]
MIERNLIGFDHVGSYGYTKNATSGNYKEMFNVTINVAPKKLNQSIVPTDINSKIIYKPENYIDLSEGIETFQDDGGNEKLETILQFIEQMDSNEKNLRKRIDSDFICNRGLLKLIALSFNKFLSLDTVEFRAIRKKNVIFMCFTSHGEEYDQMFRKTLHLATKFENCMIEDEENSQKINVFSSSEIDAVDKENNLIEIKLLKNGRNEKWQKHRALSVYLQVYLSNTHLFLFGYRLNENYEETKGKGVGYEDPGTYKVHQIELIERDNVYCKPKTVDDSICFLYDTLSHIQKMLYENDLAIYVKQSARAKFRFEYISSEDCEFVPEEFIEKFE